MPYSEAVAARVIGQYPISIATSLAIEAACGIHLEIIVDKAPILAYQELWINIRTLYRNIMGSLDKDTLLGVVPINLADALGQEMDTIVSIIGDVTNGKTKVIYYVSNYKDIETKYKVGVIRRDNTDKQKEYTEIQTQTIKLLLKAHPDNILVFDLKLKSDKQVKTLLLSHYPYDLLSSKSFGSLSLLESHTGSIKEKSQWYSKYYNGKDLVRIPFREDFIQVFGDKETFRPMNNEVRNQIIELAEKYKWSSITTHDKILYSVNTLKDHYFRKILLSILVH